MSNRLAIAALAATALIGLTGCVRDETPPAADRTIATTKPTTPTTTETTAAAAVELTGDWRDAKADWTVHFAEDGTFVEDYQGIEEFRRGSYSVDGETVTLEGDDGNPSTGTLSGNTIVFKLGTLKRQ